MRQIVPNLATPYPLATLLPPPLQEDQLAVALTAALDDVLAPVVSVLDCLGSYLDPRLAPPDFLTWLGSWVGAVVTEDGQLARGRTAVSRAVELSRARGTAAGLRDYVQVVTGAHVDVVDSGGVEWSQTPTEESETAHEPWCVVRVHGVDTGDADRIGDMVAAVKPAHVAHTVEVVGSIERN